MAGRRHGVPVLGERRPTTKPSYLIRGVPGHPLHPPLTAIPIGAYTAAMIAPLVYFANGDPVMPKATEFLLNLAIVSSLPAAVTGFVDWKRLPKHTALWKTGLIHMIVTGVATVLFIVAKNMNEDAFAQGTVTPTGYALLLGAYALMAFGGWLGGKIVFVFGYRVLAAPGSGEGGAA